MLVSPYARLRSLEMSHGGAQAIQSILTIVAVLGCAIAVRKTKDAERRLALVVAATFLATPYALTYDLPIVALFSPDSNARTPRQPLSLGEAVIYGGLWAAPLASMPLLIVGLPLTPRPNGWIFSIANQIFIVFGGVPAEFAWPLARCAGEVDCDSRSAEVAHELQLKVKEDLVEGLQRVALEQIDLAESELRGNADGDAATTMHAAP